MKKLFILSAILLSSALTKAQTIWTSETKLKGFIGKYEIVMTLAIPYGGATSCFTIGEYYYLSKKKNIDLCSEDDERIVERVDGNETGYFILKNWNKKIGQTVIGTWHTMDGKKAFPVTLKVIGKGKN
ncbi:MAG: hypothetical protein ACK50E_02800 [Bacteroidota bacterium]|jgi:hypothetical protein